MKGLSKGEVKVTFMRPVPSIGQRHIDQKLGRSYEYLKLKAYIPPSVCGHVLADNAIYFPLGTFQAFVSPKRLSLT